MKIFKKITTLVISLVMMLAMVTSAFAVDSTGTITLHIGKHNVGGVTFNAYRIMDATGSGNKVAYTINSNFDLFFTDQLLGGIDGVDKDNKAYNYLTSNVNKSTFIESLKNYIANTATVSPIQTLNGISGTKEYITNNLSYGYYAIIPSVESLSPNFTTLSKDNQDIYLKGLKPDVNKTVDNKEWASAQIGNTVHFKVESMVPNMTGYSKYYFQLTDSFSEGLTVNEASLNPIVKIGTDILESTDYTCTFDSTNSTITIEITNFINYAQNANEIITFEYEAILNEKALTNSPTTNTANISYGNNPDNLTKGTSDTVRVWTHDLTIKKVDATDKTTKLSGAGFQLYRHEVLENNLIKFIPIDASNGTYRVATADDTTTTTDTVVSPTNGVITIKGLDADTYQLVETKAPDGYNKLSASISITITATSADSGTNVTVAGNDITVENSSGTLLPETGGMGTIIFTLVGGIGVAGVIASFFISSKKKRKNNE